MLLPNIKLSVKRIMRFDFPFLPKLGKTLHLSNFDSVLQFPLNKVLFA